MRVRECYCPGEPGPPLAPVLESSKNNYARGSAPKIGMLRRIWKLLGKQTVLVKGTFKLPEGESKVVDLGDPLAGGVQVVLSRIEGQIYALDSRCPHEHGRLVGGPLHDGSVLCPLHNYLFDAKSGSVVRGACSGAKTYKAKEKDGDCEIWI